MVLIDGFKATNLSKAFLINAFVASAVALLVVELRISLENHEGTIYNYVNTNWYPGGNTSLTRTQKIQTTFIVGILASLFVYNFLYIILGFGGGMIASTKMPSYF